MSDDEYNTKIDLLVTSVAGAAQEIRDWDDLFEKEEIHCHKCARHLIREISHLLTCTDALIDHLHSGQRKQQIKQQE